MYNSIQCLTSGFDWGGQSKPRPGCFTLGKDQVPIIQEAGWVPRPVWTGTENLASPPMGLDPRTVQPVASRCTHYTIPVHERAILLRQTNQQKGNRQLSNKINMTLYYNKWNNASPSYVSTNTKDIEIQKLKAADGRNNCGFSMWEAYGERNSNNSFVTQTASKCAPFIHFDLVSCGVQIH